VTPTGGKTGTGRPKPRSRSNGPLQTREIDGKIFKCTAEEFARIRDDQIRLTERQQRMDFAAVWLPYAVSAMVLVTGLTCVLTGHAEVARWLWAGAGLGAGTSVTAAGIRHVSARKAPRSGQAAS
jgi:hypothetical protein